MSENDSARIDIVMRIVERVGVPTILAGAFAYGGYRLGDRLIDIQRQQLEHNRNVLEYVTESAKSAHALQTQQTLALEKLLRRSKE